MRIPTPSQCLFSEEKSPTNDSLGMRDVIQTRTCGLVATKVWMMGVFCHSVQKLDECLCYLVRFQIGFGMRYVVLEPIRVRTQAQSQDLDSAVSHPPENPLGVDVIRRFSIAQDHHMGVGVSRVQDGSFHLFQGRSKMGSIPRSLSDSAESALNPGIERFARTEKCATFIREGKDRQRDAHAVTDLGEEHGRDQRGFDALAMHGSGDIHQKGDGGIAQGGLEASSPNQFHASGIRFRSECRLEVDVAAGPVRSSPAVELAWVQQPKNLVPELLDQVFLALECRSIILRILWPIIQFFFVARSIFWWAASFGS